MAAPMSIPVSGSSKVDWGFSVGFCLFGGGVFSRGAGGEYILLFFVLFYWKNRECVVCTL